MRRDGNRVILETRACVWCDGTGQAAKQVVCSACKGTGNGIHGGRSGCRKCSGMGHVYSRTITETCTLCNGSGQVPENNCDSMPNEWWPDFQFRVYRQDRKQTYNEYLLAHGCVYSCTDYGTAAESTDEAIIAKVKSEERFTQLIKVADSENRLCDHIGIFVNRDGYSVRAIFSPDGQDAIETIAHERGKDEGLRVGVSIARNGGNGTLGAIYK